MTEITSVTFCGHELVVLPSDAPETTYVALKPIVIAMGLQWQAQFNKLKRNEVLGSTVSIMDIVAADGRRREAVCLPLTRLNFWLATIEANRVRPEIRETILAYQRECADALFAHFFGDAMAETEKPRVADAGDPPPMIWPLEIEGRLSVIREARRLFGASASRGLWTRAGLDQTEDMAEMLDRAGAKLRPLMLVRGWIDARLQASPNAVLPAALAYDDFIAWAEEKGWPALTRNMFARRMGEAGVGGGRSRDQRFYRGVALRQALIASED